MLDEVNFLELIQVVMLNILDVSNYHFLALVFFDVRSYTFLIFGELFQNQLTNNDTSSFDSSPFEFSVLLSLTRNVDYTSGPRTQIRVRISTSQVPWIFALLCNMSSRKSHEQS